MKRDLSRFHMALDWIAQQQSSMEHQLIAWTQINSGSFHLDGLSRMAETLESAFSVLLAPCEKITLAPLQQVDAKGELTPCPLGHALRFRKREQAPLQILFTGHYDTVFAKDSPFQTASMREGGKLNAPGAADMKGGILVMLYALMALENSEFRENIGWEILLNPDEEIGSIGSASLLVEAAKRHHFGLIFEPSLADGTLAGERKGSGNFVAVMRGKAAHAGRNPEDGRNAIVALSEFILDITALNYGNVTTNAGKIEGGGAVNVVPDLAICRFNIRMRTQDEQQAIEQSLANIVNKFNARDGFSLALHGGFTRPPKILSAANHRLFDHVKSCGEQLGLSLQEKPSGGCCDGNNLAAAGLPNVDTLGVRGGNIHSAEEFVILNSMTERAQLSALLLLRFASKELIWQ